MNYARRQQYRRLSRAARLALVGVTVAVVGMLLLSIGFALPGGLLLALAVRIGFRARHWMSLAGRSRVGAHSEDEVRRALAPLEERGWRLRHALRWQGGGDIDSVATAPNGVGFAIETKPGGTTSASSLGCSSRRAGLVGAGGGGAAAARFRSCAWFARLAWRATGVVSWWSRSAGWFRSCGKSRTAWSAIRRRR